MNKLLCFATVFLLYCSTILPQSNAEQNHDILLNKTAIHLKFFNNAIHFNSGLKNFRYKLYSVDVKNGAKRTSDVRVSRLVPDYSSFQVQPNLGLEYEKDQFVLFTANTTSPVTTAFMVEFLTANEIEQVPFGHGFINPFEELETDGYRNITIIDKYFNVIGEAKISYLVIRPITRFNPMVNSYNTIQNVSFAGHRGTGVGVRTDRPEHFVENTISAFNFACSKSADMIELDVQLTVDKVPIIYHDFIVKTFLVNRHDANKNVSFRIPLKDFSFKNTKQISTNYMPHLTRNVSPQSQSFETLEEVLKQLNPNCGINVEIKYPQLKETLVYDGVRGTELNEYVDRILEVLYAHANDRKIFITSFHADLCSMVQLKQNKFRVGFLTSGSTKKWNPKSVYLFDPRATTVENGVAFAQSMHLNGLSLLADNLFTSTPGKYQYIDYIKQRNLSLFLWGGSLNNTKLVMDLHKHGVDILIFDKIDVILTSHINTNTIDDSQ